MLNRWAGFVYGPLLEDRTRRIQEKSSGVYGREVAESVHADLRQQAAALKSLDPLVRRDRNLALEPALAVKWAQTSPTVWRFDLRPNRRRMRRENRRTRRGYQEIEARKPAPPPQ